MQLKYLPAATLTDITDDDGLAQLSWMGKDFTHTHPPSLKCTNAL